jgi:hypothetical protein
MSFFPLFFSPFLFPFSLFFFPFVFRGAEIKDILPIYLSTCLPDCQGIGVSSSRDEARRDETRRGSVALRRVSEREAEGRGRGLGV